MHYWTPADREWLRTVDRFLSEDGLSLDELAGERAEDLRDILLDAARRFSSLTAGHATTPDMNCADDCPACTGLVPAGTDIYAGLVPAGPEADQSGTDSGTTAVAVPDEVGTSPIVVPVELVPAPAPVGTGSGTGPIVVPPLVPGQRKAVPAGTGSGTGPDDELTALGTKLYREAVAAGTKLSERALADAMGQTGRRLARQIIASVRAEMAMEGAQNA